MTKYWISLALLTIAVPSQAVVYTGNPDLGFWVQRPANDLTGGTVTIYKVRIHKCDSTYVDYVLNDTIDDVVDGYTVNNIIGGDLCGATWFWSTDMFLDGYSSGPFTIEYDDNTTTMVFASPLVPTALTPYTVIEGSAPGTGPKLYATITP